MECDQAHAKQVIAAREQQLTASSKVVAKHRTRTEDDKARYRQQHPTSV